MGSPGTGALRVTRALVLAVCAVLLAVGGHLAGGGRPSVAVTLVVAAMSAAVATLVAARQVGTLAITGCIAAGQVGFHLLLSLQPAHGMAAGAAGGGPTGTPGGMATGVVPDLRMLLGHVAATVLVAVLLARGERWVWLVASLLAPGVRLLVPGGTGAALLRPQRPRDTPDRPVRPVGLVELGLRHRGPPAAATA